MINDIVLTPEDVSLVGGEGPTNGDALIREAHVTFGGDASKFSGKDGDLGHRWVMITHDAASYLACQMSWVHLCSSNLVVHMGRCVCLRWLRHQNTRVYPGSSV
jgi:hypothetical protein